MNKAGLFGGGWEDYLDTLNDAFDRHAADNAPPHPFGASADAIMTGYPDDKAASSAPFLDNVADGGNPAQTGAPTGAYGPTSTLPARIVAMQSPSGGEAIPDTSGGNGHNLIGEVAGKLWDLPNTALGLGAGAIAGLATLATGQVPHIGFGNGAIQISNLKDLSSLGMGGALTLGDVQLYNGVKPDTQITPGESPYIQPDGSNLGGFTYGKHEGAHTIVDDSLGPFALPLYLFSAIKNGWITNPYEQKADQHAAYGVSPFP